MQLHKNGVVFWMVLALQGLAFSLMPTIARSADSTQVTPPVTLPDNCRATLRFLQDKVAAGALPTVEHQAPFKLTLTDKAGKPLAGVRVPLPLIVQGGRGPKEGPLAARVAWDKPYREKADDENVGLTDKTGMARGTFTSGNRTEPTVLQMPGKKYETVKASILQVWNEEDKEKRWDNEFLPENRGEHILYKIRYQHNNPDNKPGDNDDANKDANNPWIPITGHSLELALTKLAINVWHPDRGPDEDGDNKPDGEYEELKLSDEDADKTNWEHYLKFVKIGPWHETLPGCYAITVILEIPQAEDGQDLFTFDSWSYDVYDNYVYDIDGATD